MKGYARGHGLIMDNKYRIVRSVEPGGATLASDMHEFYVLPGGRSALMTIYKPSPYDLSAFGVTNGVGYIQEGIFQEVDIESGAVIFEWRSLDHIDPSESFVPPDTTEISGDGLTKETPWDYIHINSIDKNEAGDYLVSARHVSCIYKISGVHGSVIWRLHGKHSSFRLTNFHFSSQHDARWLSENSTHTVMSIFDNGSNGFNETKPFSQGLIVAIDHIAMTATSIREYNAPDKSGGLQSQSQGNMQVLDNGNVVQGWGNNAFLSEHTEDGKDVWYGSIALTGTMIYRCYKFNWTATPNTAPSLWTYSKTGTKEDGMVFYVSWNGATEVRTWKFYTAEAKQGPYNFLASTPKNGFETTFKHDSFSPYSYVEALDAARQVLGRGEYVKSFVPGAEIVDSCDGFGCNDARVLTQEEKIQKEEERKEEEEEERKEKEEEERKEKEEEERKEKEEEERKEKEEEERKEKEEEEEEEERRRQKAKGAKRRRIVFGIGVVFVLHILIFLFFRRSLCRTSLVWSKHLRDHLSILGRKVLRRRYRRVAKDEPRMLQ
jgi:hypothetical protein